MSETFTSYLISVAILFALALFIPCVESLASMLRTPIRNADENGELKACTKSRDAA